MPVAGVAVSGGYAGDDSVIRAGLPGRGRLCPGAEVFGAGIPRQEPFQRLAGGRFPAVAAAFVEVRGEPGQELRPAIRAVAVTVQMTAAFRAVSPFRDPPAFFLVTTGPRICRSAALLSSDTIG